jgi:hypothetical protein
MGTSAGARRRYTTEGVDEFRKIISDLKDRGYSEVGISRAAWLSEGRITAILHILNSYGDHAFLVEPETLEKLRRLHARILSQDPPDIDQKILRRRIRQARNRQLAERKGGRPW